MPIFCHEHQVVVLKQAIIDKYVGGVQHFKLDYGWTVKRDHEDRYLISVVLDKYETPRIEYLDYDPSMPYSTDYMFVSRRAREPLWNVPWLTVTFVYMWHNDTSWDIVNRVKDSGNVLFSDIEGPFHE